MRTTNAAGLDPSSLAPGNPQGADVGAPDAAALDPSILEAGIAKMREHLRVTSGAIERWKKYPLFAAFCAAMAMPQEAGTFDKVEARRRFVAALDHARRHHPEALDDALSIAGEIEENGETIYSTGRKVSEHMISDVYRILCDFADSRGITYVGADRVARELLIDVSTVRRAQTVIDNLQGVGCFDRWRRDDRERWPPGGNWQTVPRSHVHYLPMLPETEDDGHMPCRSKRAEGRPQAGRARADAQTPAPAKPPAPRSTITPSGREAAFAAIRAHAELAELDTIAHADAIWTASKKGKDGVSKTHLLAKAMSELAEKIRDGEINLAQVKSFRGLACAFARDVLPWGESDDERLAAENADLPGPGACRAVLGKVTDLAAAAARADQERAGKLAALEASGPFVPAPPELFAFERKLAGLEAEKAPGEAATGPPGARPRMT